MLARERPYSRRLFAAFLISDAEDIELHEDDGETTARTV